MSKADASSGSNGGAGWWTVDGRKTNTGRVVSGPIELGNRAEAESRREDESNNTGVDERIRDKANVCRSGSVRTGCSVEWDC